MKLFLYLCKVKTKNYRNMERLQLTGLLLVAASIMPLCAQTVRTTIVRGTGPNDEEGPSMVCDGRYDTKWCIDSRRQLPYTIVLDASAEATIAEYGFVTGDDTQQYPDRNPVSWRLQGSNNMDQWTLLDEQSNNRSMGDENHQEYLFRPTFKGKYRYYRFEFLRMAGSTRIQLSEINLYKTAKAPIATKFAGGQGNGEEGAAMVADGKYYTKWCIDQPASLPYTVCLDAGAATEVSEYVFVTGDDTHDYPDRNPVSWSVAGSNDQTTWTTLDEQKFNRRLRDENEQEYRFKPAVTGNWRYYRFQFHRMTAGTRLQLSEIKLYK